MAQGDRFPGGVFIGFVGFVDRKAAEQIALIAKEAVLGSGMQTVTLLMSSMGGMVDCAFYAASVLQALPAKIVTYNIGDIASAGNIVFLAGAERYAIPGSTIYFHQASSPNAEVVTSAVLQYRLRGFQLGNERIAQRVSERTGRQVDEVRHWHVSERLMDAAEALETGVIHGISSPVIPADALFHQIVF